jgi:hypothetical protein
MLQSATLERQLKFTGLRRKVVVDRRIVKLLAEGLGVHGTAIVTYCDPHTVLDVLVTIGQKCLTIDDRIVGSVKTDALQLDELWSRVWCSQKRASQIVGGDEIGDQYTYLARCRSREVYY